MGPVLYIIKVDKNLQTNPECLYLNLDVSCVLSSQNYPSDLLQ